MTKPPVLKEINPVDTDHTSNDSGSDSETESEVLIEKPKGKGKYNYVLTEARKAAFEKARQKRDEYRAIRKAEKEKEQAAFLKVKNEKIARKEKREQVRREMELKALEPESSSEEEVIVKKKPKKKRVIYVDEDDEEPKDGHVIIINKIGDTKKSEPPVAMPKKPIGVFV